MKVSSYFNNSKNKRKQESDIDSRPAKKQDIGKENVLPVVHKLHTHALVAVPALAPRSVGRPKKLSVLCDDLGFKKEKGTVGRPYKSDDNGVIKGLNISPACLSFTTVDSFVFNHLSPLFLATLISTEFNFNNPPKSSSVPVARAFDESVRVEEAARAEAIAAAEAVTADGFEEITNTINLTVPHIKNGFHFTTLNFGRKKSLLEIFSSFWPVDFVVKVLVARTRGKAAEKYFFKRNGSGNGLIMKYNYKDIMQFLSIFIYIFISFSFCSSDAMRIDPKWWTKKRLTSRRR